MHKNINTITANDPLLLQYQVRNMVEQAQTNIIEHKSNNQLGNIFFYMTRSDYRWYLLNSRRRRFFLLSEIISRKRLNLFIFKIFLPLVMNMIKTLHDIHHSTT